MKNILLITFLFLLGVNCDGQYPVQKNLPSKDSILVKIIGSGTQVFPKTHSELFAEQMAKQDTIRVLMLLCDTTSKSISIGGVSLDSSGEVIKIHNPKYYDSSVWWQFGYVIYPSITFRAAFQDQVPNKFYLDQTKKPLSKSIIVWMTKEIKN